MWSKTNLASASPLPPVTAKPDKNAQVNAWAETNPLLTVQDEEGTCALSPTTKQKYQQHKDLQGHYVIMVEDVH